jgi:hypothetical protein
MLSFAVKLRDGKHLLGIALGDEEIDKLKTQPVLLDLESVGVGLWFKEKDGSRSFMQPCDSNVLLAAGDSTEDVGALLQVQLPSLSEIKRRAT